MTTKRSAGVTFSDRVILLVGSGTRHRLESFVAKCVEDHVKWIALVGIDSAAIEEDVDEFLVGDGSNSRFILASSHAETELQDALRMLQGSEAAPIDIIRL